MLLIPHLTKRFPESATDDTEARLCWRDETPIEFLELYVKNMLQI